MSYQAVLQGNNTYIVEFNVDLTNPVEVANVSSNGISFSLYTATPASTPLGYVENTLITDYLPNATFQLYYEEVVQHIRFDTGAPYDDFIYHPIFEYDPTNLATINNEQFVVKTLTNGVFNFYLTNNPAVNADDIAQRIDFAYDVTYRIGINLATMISGEQDNTHHTSFITGSATVDPTQAYNTYPCNVITSANKLDLIKDIDVILDTEAGYISKLNYQYVTTDKKLLRFDINSILETLYIKQYLPEYVNYFNSLNDPSIRTSTIDNASNKQISDLKKIILKNSNLVNSSFKGNKKGMSIVVDVFCQVVGQHLLSLERSPNLHNFMYRVTTSLPKDYWISDIRPIIHPVSWKDEYIYVDVVSSIKNLWFDTGRHLPKEFCTSYLDISNKERYHMYPQVFDLSIFEDYHTPAKFNFNANNYEADTTGYANTELITMLNDNKMHVTLDVAATQLNVAATYDVEGVALEYVWNVYIHTSPNAVLYNSVTTYKPEFKIALPYSAERFMVEVELKNRDFSTTINAQLFALDLLDRLVNFDYSSISKITFLIAEFKSYIWTFKTHNTQSVINTITTKRNYVDASAYPNADVYLTLVYGDGTQKVLSTFLTIDTSFEIGTSTIGDGWIG